MFGRVAAACFEGSCSAPLGLSLTSFLGILQCVFGGPFSWSPRNVFPGCRVIKFWSGSPGRDTSDSGCACDRFLGLHAVIFGVLFRIFGDDG